MDPDSKPQLTRQYGLILPKKLQPNPPIAIIKKPSVFRESDEESDDESPTDWMQKTKAKEQYGGYKHSTNEIKKLMNEDPSIYQYDEVYDKIEKKRLEESNAKQIEKKERKPRYIQKLMVTAEKRKRENEIRLTRQIQKEREAEGNEFADKEVFVTSAYKKKLEEMKVLEEQEREQDRLEAIGDVTKQSDLSGFYRHIYEKVVLDVEDENKDVEKLSSKKKEKQAKYSRQYRKRKASESSEDEMESVCKKEETNSPIRDEPIVEFQTQEMHSCTSKSEELVATTFSKANSVATEDRQDDADVTEDSHLTSHQNDDDEDSESEIIEPEKPKIKVDVWKKRTVGDIFTDALRRYYERKTNRQIASV